MKAIDSFSGQYHWLSNFSSHGFYISGVWFKTNEHFYQAMKTLDEKERLQIIECDSPQCAKKLGKMCTIRDNWDKIKIEIMWIGLKNKFDQNPELKRYLLETGDIELIEGNWWNDRFFGQCPIGIGENHLGKLLMKLREQYKNEKTIKRFF